MKCHQYLYTVMKCHQYLYKVTDEIIATDIDMNCMHSILLYNQCFRSRSLYLNDSYTT